MTPEQYAERMKDMGIEREGLETRLKPMFTAHPRFWKESAYLPGGLDKSIVPLPPPDISEDLSHLNPRQHGKKGGRPAKQKAISGIAPSDNPL